MKYLIVALFGVVVGMIAMPMATKKADEVVISQPVIAGEIDVVIKTIKTPSEEAAEELGTLINDVEDGINELEESVKSFSSISSTLDKIIIR